MFFLEMKITISNEVKRVVRKRKDNDIVISRNNFKNVFYLCTTRKKSMKCAFIEFYHFVNSSTLMHYYIKHILNLPSHILNIIVFENERVHETIKTILDDIFFLFLDPKPTDNLIIFLSQNPKHFGLFRSSGSFVILVLIFILNRVSNFFQLSYNTIYSSSNFQAASLKSLNHCSYFRIYLYIRGPRNVNNLVFEDIIRNSIWLL